VSVTLDLLNPKMMKVISLYVCIYVCRVVPASPCYLTSYTRCGAGVYVMLHWCYQHSPCSQPTLPTVHQVLRLVHAPLRGCKNRPAPFPGRMLYKATKPGSVTALVPTRLDCGNASLAGLPTCQLNRLQSVRSSRSCTVRLWVPELWLCNASAPGTPLVVCSGSDHV